VAAKAAELHRLGLLTTVDTAALGAYCQAYSTWRTAVEVNRQVEANDTVMKGLLVKAPGGSMVNPLNWVISSAAKAMVRYASEFGMSPAARARIAVGVNPEPPSRFDGLLKG
jgi:P27 family predicted phage terminase small subunit